MNGAFNVAGNCVCVPNLTDEDRNKLQKMMNDSVNVPTYTQLQDAKK